MIGVNYMFFWDVVWVFKEMIEGGKGKVVVVGLYWGMFVIELEEVLKILGGLEWVCER